MKVPIQIRVEKDDLEKWQAKAGCEDVSLSEWIRLACAARMERGGRPYPRVEAESRPYTAETPLPNAVPDVPKKLDAVSAPGKTGKLEFETDLRPIGNLREEPVYKSHPKDCPCQFCAFAIKAGLKKPRGGEPEEPKKKGFKR
jgi:hypothetical protein